MRTGTIRPRERATLLATAFLLGLAGLPGALAEDVTTDIDRTGTLASGTYADFHVSILSGKEASIYVVATGTVDFYVMSESVFSGYTNPFNDFFVAERSRERVDEFSFRLSESGKVVVIDNVRKSTTGADPTGPVTYTIRVTYGDAWNPLVVCGIGLLPVVAILAIAFVIWNRRQNAREAAAKGAPPPLPPPTP